MFDVSHSKWGLCRQLDELEQTQKKISVLHQGMIHDAASDYICVSFDSNFEHMPAHVAALSTEFRGQWH